MADRAGRVLVLAEYNVSRETSASIDVFVAELERWQRIINLVGPATLPDLWLRHVADSLQLLQIAPEARRWLDLGSGAGFPGLVVAIALAESSSAEVHLVESNQRKCAFLRNTVRLTSARAIIHAARIESVLPELPAGLEIVTARALAPLSQLLAWTEPLLKTGTVALFPKGRDVQAELTDAAKSWRFTFDLIPSRTDSDSRIVRVRSLERA